jgi:putative ABC transport system permease protein
VTSTLVAVSPRLAIAVVLLAAVGAAASAIGRLGVDRRVVAAAARAVVQLAAVSFVITAIVDSVPLTTAFIAVMYTVAARVSARRMTEGRSGWWAAAPITAGSLPVVAGLLVSGLVPLNGLAVIPVTGILIGGAMTATSPAGRRALDDLRTRRGEVEAALSLGLSDREAALEICRPAASQARHDDRARRAWADPRHDVTGHLPVAQNVGSAPSGRPIANTSSSWARSE